MAEIGVSSAIRNVKCKEPWDPREKSPAELSWIHLLKQLLPTQGKVWKGTAR